MESQNLSLGSLSSVGHLENTKKNIKPNTTIQQSAVCSFGHNAEHMGRCPGDHGVRLPNVVDAKDCFGIHFETPLPRKLGCVFDDFCPLRTLFSPFGRRGGGPCAARGRPGGPEEGSSPIWGHFWSSFCDAFVLGFHTCVAPFSLSIFEVRRHRFYGNFRSIWEVDLKALGGLFLEP